ncbi:MAG: winged helix-turn-helix domain-containing protein, partial [Candidatus Omnitrophica bacterium]|nr:winged helix-turn-helix domain-containing protein [Candidatus Omnitrophota bacterium]
MNKNSFVNVAYKVLKEKKNPLTAKEITEIGLSKGLIKTEGKTPEATVGARIYVDIKKKGEDSLFEKVSAGKFGLREWQSSKEKAIFHKKGSFKRAAYEVLKSNNKPLNMQEITNIAKKKGLLTTLGKTPENTMGAQLYTDIKKSGAGSPFVQLGKNKFGL